ncbi:MAG: lipoyl(octanoyl) transferase LipB [Planctomycetota bacterium]|jgi:lipoate-protein ligase B
MPDVASDHDRPGPSVEAHLLDRVDFDLCLSLQRRIVEHVGSRLDGQIRLLLCEHPEVITVGRGGSAAEVQHDSGWIKSRRIEARWVKRGGSCMLHAPGQLAVYPVVPLRWHGFSVGEYLERFQSGILDTLDGLGIRGLTRRGRFGVWGRTGQLAAFGIAVSNWIAYHGAFINVCPSMGLFRLVETDPEGDTRMSCLVAERGRPVRMTGIRVELVRRLTEAFGCTRHHLYTGHPLLKHAAVSRP